MTLFGIGFLSPWLLLGLLALPILWIILRAVPPAPIRRMFPAVVLLLGLKDDDQVTDRTPWWLLLLRILAVAAVILGLAGPILNPREAGERGSGPLLIAMDASWASAGDWAAQQEALEALLLEAQRDGRTGANYLEQGESRQALGGLLRQGPSQGDRRHRTGERKGRNNHQLIAFGKPHGAVEHWPVMLQW